MFETKELFLWGILLSYDMIQETVTILLSLKGACNLGQDEDVDFSWCHRDGDY